MSGARHRRYAAPMSCGGNPGCSELVKTVALIDGNAGIRYSLGLLIEAQGWNTLAFASGEHFLDGLPDREPDCLILDPHLSGMSGLEVVTVLTQRSAQFPIIGLSTWPTSRVTADFSNAPITELLIKPVPADVLIDKLRVAMRTAPD